MHQFVERHKLLKLTQGEIGHLNITISIKDTESIINNLSIKILLNTSDLTGQFSQEFKEEYMTLCTSQNL